MKISPLMGEKPIPDISSTSNEGVHDPLRGKINCQPSWVYEIL